MGSRQQEYAGGAWGARLRGRPNRRRPFEPDLGNAGVGKQTCTESKPPASRPGGFFVVATDSEEGEPVRVIIIAAGQSADDKSWARWIRKGNLVIGADGGAAQALAWGITPQVVVGDMDSLTESHRARLEAQGCEFVQHPRAKDETDLELALGYAVEQGADEIVILGALGGRMDHTLANVLLLALPLLRDVTARIVRGGEEVLLLRGGQSIRLEGQKGNRVSLLPVEGDACGVATRGLAWPLNDDTLRFGFSRGVSNEMTGSEAWIDLREGSLVVVHVPLPAGEESVR